ATPAGVVKAEVYELRELVLLPGVEEIRMSRVDPTRGKHQPTRRDPGIGDDELQRRKSDREARGACCPLCVGCLCGTAAERASSVPAAGKPHPQQQSCVCRAR